MDDPRAVRPAGQVFDQLDEKNFDGEVQRNGLDGVTYRRFPFGRRPDKILAVVNDLLKVAA